MTQLSKAARAWSSVLPVSLLFCQLVVSIWLHVTPSAGELSQELHGSGTYFSNTSWYFAAVSLTTASGSST